MNDEQFEQLFQMIKELSEGQKGLSGEVKELREGQKEIRQDVQDIRQDIKSLDEKVDLLCVNWSISANAMVGAWLPSTHAVMRACFDRSYFKTRLSFFDQVH
ncbi:hypothetical protein [Lentibacillus amyloliquefaciens]|uniref:DUF5082 domain-containing protein n=1 Tax=Lentibacillus amyloliquefaciens TaxID=1472767 RepID=A0A0U3NP51_9BACI|nr:hypothetical protein [Lentibacillus amyloliquefaciens]ALX48507.1 hypothetical protein AOX59_07730 [Lentibacillus amyloliquefaciens]